MVRGRKLQQHVRRNVGVHYDLIQEHYLFRYMTTFHQYIAQFAGFMEFVLQNGTKGGIGAFDADSGMADEIKGGSERPR